MANQFVDKLCKLAPLDDADVKRLTELTAAPKQISRLRDLIREGDQPGPVFVILSGWACRYKVLPTGSRQITALLMPGDSCDLRISLLAEMDHSIQTLTAATVATISKEAITAALAERPKIAHALYTAQLIDEGTLRAWIVSMGRRTSVERVAHLMCELYMRARDIGLTAEQELQLPLSQATLADCLGLTPVHVNRVLKVLREAGAMTLQRGSLQISDPGRLVRIAGFDENYLHRRLRAVA